MQLLASRQKKKRKRNNASTLAKIHPVAKLQKCHVLRVACWTRRLWIIVLTKICRLLFATYNVTFLTFYNTIPTIILLVYYLKVSLFSSSTCLRAYCHEGPLFVDRMSLIHYHFVALLLLENPFDSPVDVCATLFHKHWPRAGADRTLTKNAKWRKKKEDVGVHHVELQDSILLGGTSGMWQHLRGPKHFDKRRKKNLADGLRTLRAFI